MDAAMLGGIGEVGRATVFWSDGDSYERLIHVLALWDWVYLSEHSTRWITPRSFVLWLVLLLIISYLQCTQLGMMMDR